VNQVGIVLRDRSELPAQASAKLIEYLESKHIKYFVIYSREGEIDGKVAKRIPQCDLSVAFGGDGTLLFTARVFSKYGVPIVGINLGGLGFITEFREEEVLECVECFMEGHYSHEPRMMRLYRADGIIIATPTGSTGYSLAAGGPIVEPNMSALIICPICPHSLGARPLVVPAEETIRIKVLSQRRSVTATVDGQVAIELADGDEVHVLKSDLVTKLISVGKRSFFDIVREKLAWKG